MFTKIVLLATLRFLGAGAVDDCAKSPDACASTLDENALLQRRVKVSMAEADNFTEESHGEASTLEHTLQKKGNIIEQAVNAGGDLVNAGGNAIASGANALGGAASGVVNDVMDSEVGDILKDVAHATESAVVSVKNKIERDFGNLAKFLETHVQKAIDILAAVFNCMTDLFDQKFDCASTWLNQGKECLAGNTCQLSIGYPKCSELATEYLFGTSYTREYPLLAQKDNVTTQQRQGAMYKVTRAGYGEHGQESEKSKFIHETLTDFGSDDQNASIETNAGLSQIEEEGGLIIGSWDNDHADEDVRGLRTSGKASLHAGLHMNVNLDNTIVKAEIKSELHFEGSIDVHASGSRTKEIPQTDITPPKRLLRKIIMVGKIPVEVLLSVKLVYSGSVEVSGSVEGGVKVTQEVHLSNYIEYNFEKLTEMPYYSFTAQTWDPTVEPYFSASGSVVATLNIGPLFTLSVNRAPFDWGVMPQIVATASAQLDSNLRCAAASATFEVTTNLAGSMGVGLPHIDPATKAYEACMAMKAAVMLNPAAQAGNCLAKAVLKFDVNSAMEDSCNAMRSTIPSFPSMRWDWTVGTTELFSQDYAGQACIQQAQNAATNRIQQEANRQPSSSPVFEWLEQTSFDGTKCVGNPEGSAADLPTSGAYTIEAMIKPTGGGVFGIVGWGSYYHHSRVNAFRMGSTHYLVNYWWGNDLGKHLGTNLADGKFHHVAATYDGHTQRIFVDNSQVASRHASGYSATDKSSFCVGKTVNNEYFRGEMKKC